ncbi:four helix bundle protein [Candidatus Parcubacteria bacterium]|nr:MAG: four helix bundle protein [Candidatus Parcubacteria bacterium]
MTNINFENHPLWQGARSFVKEVYKLLAAKPALLQDAALSDQFKRRAYSVMFNVAKGLERTVAKETAHFLNIAKGATAEVISVLYILWDNNYISEEEFRKLHNKMTQLAEQISQERQKLTA